MNIEAFVDSLRNVVPGYSRIRTIDSALAAQIVALYDQANAPMPTRENFGEAMAKIWDTTK